ncbi:MAG: aspartate kinase [Anaerolineae bacterium]|nr:aspartate kinase [Anaerolineae bacterium]MDW8173127.1 aspartate kinase [Anaerolineae bacterium]
MSTLVMKFGGSAIGTPAALTQVLSIVIHEHQRWDHLVLVASALDGVTDMLLEAAYLAQMSNQRGYRRIAATLRTRHIALVEALPLGQQERVGLLADIDRLLFEMLDVCQSVASSSTDTLSPQATDAIASCGERLSSRVIAGLLRQNNLLGVAIDGMDVIITDDVHGNATPNLPLTHERIQQTLVPMLARHIIPVVTGFIGATRQGKITTMGRGGSDYTASILSTSINANELWIWSDVDGMMTADPREYEDAQMIPLLSYDEVAEMAYFGARILHARMIRPLRERSIPIRVKNVYKPQGVGTLIQPYTDDYAPQMKAVTSVQAVTLSAARAGSITQVLGLVDQVFQATIGSPAEVTLSSQSSSSTLLCFIIPPSIGTEIVDTLRSNLEEALRGFSDTVSWRVRPATVISLLGSNIDRLAHLWGGIMQAISHYSLLGIAQGPSHCSLSLIVEPQDAEGIIQRVHPLVLKSASDNAPAPRP